MTLPLGTEARRLTCMCLASNAMKKIIDVHTSNRSFCNMHSIDAHGSVGDVAFRAHRGQAENISSRRVGLAHFT